MAVAQDTPILPAGRATTYLDVAHQLDVIDLVERLNKTEGKTIVMVLHDLNEAARVRFHRRDARWRDREGGHARRGLPARDADRALYGVTCDIYPHSTRAGATLLHAAQWRVSTDVRDFQGRATPTGTIYLLRSRTWWTGYGRTTIIDNLSPDLPAGKVIAMVGPNGCGKSTLFRPARLLKRSCRRIDLDGIEIASGSHKALAKRMALLSQAVAALRIHGGGSCRIRTGAASRTLPAMAG